MLSHTREKLAGMAFLSALFTGISTFALPTTLINTPDSETAERRNHILLIEKVLEEAVKSSVLPVNYETLAVGAITGALKAIDPHSGYISTDEYARMQSGFNGGFGGIGVNTKKEGKFITIVELIPGTPAARIGIKAGDVITHIDGKNTAEMSLSDSGKLLRGKVDTHLTLTVRRKDQDNPVTFTLVRQKIKIETVETKVLAGNIGYIKIINFDDRETGENLEKGVEKLEKETDGKLSGYILDLRDDLGGRLHESVEVSDAFIDQNGAIIVITRDRDGKEKKETSAAGDVTRGKKMIVLVNGNSASASEIVAGALQDHGRAEILGVQTYGKGSVQTIDPLSKFSSERRDAVRITSELYFTPHDRSIQGVGITPDILYDDKETYLRETRYDGVLPNPNGIEKPDAAQTKASCDPDPAYPAGTKIRDDFMAANGKPDYQLICAVERLQGKHTVTRVTPK